MSKILKNADFFKMYLGEKNKQKPLFKKNINYVDDIKGLITNSEAKSIVDFIAEFVEAKNIIAVESSAKLGTLTSTFLDDPHFSSVICFEPNHLYRKMLKNNLVSWKYRDSNYAISSTDDFLELPKEFYKTADSNGNISPIVIHLAPTWIPEKNKGYKIGKHTLEEILDNNREAAIITMQLPNNYQFNNLKGYKLGSIEMKDFYLYYAVPTSKKTSGRKNGDDEEDMKQELIESGGFALKKSIKFPEDYKKGIPKMKSGFDLWNDKNTEEWENAVREFMRKDFLPKIELPEDKIIKITDDEAMKTWYAIFTHETYDPNIGNNYEQLETLGDAIIKTTFADWMIQKWPTTISPGELTDFTQKILKGATQTKVSIHLGLHMLIRTRARPTEGNFEDILEALFGGVLKLGNEKLKMLGYPLSEMFMNMMLDLFVIDLNYLRQASKIIVGQIFKKLQWGDPEEVNSINENERLVETKVKLTGQAISDIFKLTKLQVKPFLGFGKGKDKKIASEIAYENARKELEKYGITKDYASMKIKERRFNDPEFKEYKNKLLKILSGKGYVDIEFKVHKKKKDSSVIIWGVKDDGMKEFIYAIIEDGMVREPAIYVKTIKEYLKTL